jgi:hypothetical protein
MKYIASVLGIKSRYALDRFEGRYRNINDEKSHRHMVYQLEGHDMIDFPFSGFWVDTEYGSSVFTNIEAGREFRVLKTATGLIVRSEASSEPEESIMDKAMDIIDIIM